MSGDRVPFLDLATQHRVLLPEITRRWTEIAEHAAFVSGRWVEAFERRFAEMHGVRHCVAVANGTDALELALRALGAGPGDEVLLPTNSFIATAEAVSNVGAVPVLVDCDRHSNIDVSLLESRATDRTVGAIGVHLYGNPCDMDEINALAAARGWWTMEDSAQGHLASYRGRMAGSLGRIAAFSFYPGKNLGAPGEGGAVTTDDDGLADAVRMLRNHGQSRKYESDVVGGNSRMPELVAAVLELKCAHLAGWTASRRAHAAAYRGMLEGSSVVETIDQQDDRESAVHLFVVHADRRDELADHLSKAGIDTGRHYPIPIHRQVAYRGAAGAAGAFPAADHRAPRLLSLPMFPELTGAQIGRVVEAIGSFR
jgi:dTDP-4-amino-4,6-dideoxygalactose transaminase